MSDIVERLRKLADRERPYGSLPDTLDEAANEIERFKASLADVVTQTQEQADEIERLRAALRPFADVLRGNWSHQQDEMVLDVGFGPTDLRLKLRLGDFRIARAALEGK